MKQILILIFVLSLIGCEFMKERYVPPASESEIDFAWSDVYKCLKSNMAIDDGISDASTIAKSLVGLCRNEYNQAAYAHVKGQNQRVQQIYFAKVGNSYVDHATSYVLIHRKKARDAK